MERELQDYYEDRFSMFASKGWRELIEDVQKLEQAVNTLDSATTADMFHFRKGQLDMIRWVLNLEAVCRDEYDAQLAEAQQ